VKLDHALVEMSVDKKVNQLVATMVGWKVEQLEILLGEM
jgi:hypothetical protein